MKLYLRLLLTIPFVVVTFVFYKLVNPDAFCNGPIVAIITLVVYGAVLFTGLLAAFGTFRKRQFKPEPVTLFISFITLMFIIYRIAFSGHTTGDEWIVAENKNLSDWQESKSLTLRKNGNFTYFPNQECAFSGEYKKNGDTIILDKNTIDTNEVSLVYLLTSNKLVPLFDKKNKITFIVTKTK